VPFDGISPDELRLYTTLRTRAGVPPPNANSVDRNRTGTLLWSRRTAPTSRWSCQSTCKGLTVSGLALFSKGIANRDSSLPDLQVFGSPPTRHIGFNAFFAEGKPARFCGGLFFYQRTTDGE
jgi:hypothetical protein